MASLTARFTSKDIQIDWLPCSDTGDGTEQAHIQHLYFHADVAAGTFKLRVNGVLTAAITYSATIATLLASINTQLDAVTANAGDIVASGASDADITLTGADPFYYEIYIEEDALTGNTSDDPNLTTRVTTQGCVTVRISTEVSEFSFEGSVETVDVTAISEYERLEIPVAEAVSFDMSIFKTNSVWELSVKQGISGILTVYPRGKFVGEEVFSFRALIDKVSESYPDHDIVEKQITGVRQGAWVIRPNSIYSA
jgi:hypothetical protein